MGELSVEKTDVTDHTKPDVSEDGFLDLRTLIPEIKTGQRKSVILVEKLLQVQEKLKKKEEECETLTKEQILTGEEIQDFTASLFEEANKLIQEANLKKSAAEKKLSNAVSKIEVLEVEVSALKKMVTSSFEKEPKEMKLNPSISKFIKGHKRSTSHQSFVKPEYGESSGETKLVDTCRFELFRRWRLSPKLDESQEFIQDLIECDIHPCLCFPNIELAKEVQKAVFMNTLSINPLNRHASNGCCQLLKLEIFCEFIMTFEASSDPYTISRPARDRIIAACDLISYLRYVSLGLVKSNDADIFKEVLQRLKKMCLARLGIE